MRQAGLGRLEWVLDAHKKPAAPAKAPGKGAAKATKPPAGGTAA